jgi:hypothetical protein
MLSSIRTPVSLSTLNEDNPFSFPIFQKALFSYLTRIEQCPFTLEVQAPDTSTVQRHWPDSMAHKVSGYIPMAASLCATV